MRAAQALCFIRRRRGLFSTLHRKSTPLPPPPPPHQKKAAAATQQEPGTKKLWGGRFTGKTDPLMEKFNESLPVDKRMWAEDIQVSPAGLLCFGFCFGFGFGFGFWLWLWLLALALAFGYLFSSGTRATCVCAVCGASGTPRAFARARLGAPLLQETAGAVSTLGG